MMSDAKFMAWRQENAPGSTAAFGACCGVPEWDGEVLTFAKAPLCSKPPRAPKGYTDGKEPSMNNNFCQTCYARFNEMKKSHAAERSKAKKPREEPEESDLRDDGPSRASAAAAAAAAVAPQLQAATCRRLEAELHEANQKAEREKQLREGLEQSLSELTKAAEERDKTTEMRERVLTAAADELASLRRDLEAQRKEAAAERERANKAVAALAQQKTEFEADFKAAQEAELALRAEVKAHYQEEANTLVKEYVAKHNKTLEIKTRQMETMKKNSENMHAELENLRAEAATLRESADKAAVAHAQLKGEAAAAAKENESLASLLQRHMTLSLNLAETVKANKTELAATLSMAVTPPCSPFGSTGAPHCVPAASTAISPPQFGPLETPSAQVTKERTARSPLKDTSNVSM